MSPLSLQEKMEMKFFPSSKSGLKILRLSVGGYQSAVGGCFMLI